MVNWKRIFSNKDNNNQVTIPDENILNVFGNYIPNKYITVDDKDFVWMNETIKLNIKAKYNIDEKYIQNRRFENNFILLETLITEFNELVSTTEAFYYENLGKKWNYPLLRAKIYCSILKTFYNGKRIPLIPPLLVDDKFLYEDESIYFQ